MHFNEIVKRKLIKEADTKVFTIKLRCKTSSSGEDELTQEFSIRAQTPENAKTQAIAMAKEAGFIDCSIEDVSMVVDPLDPNSANFGQGSIGANPNATKGNVGPGN